MGATDSHRLLIVCNSVMSRTRANGKTIFSFFDRLPKESVRQLYFLKESPTISGYNYFQITDEDIIKGVMNPAKRGREYTEVEDQSLSDFIPRPSKIKKPLFRLIRELVWKNRWHSRKLDKWLDDFAPTEIFFVAGDSAFAYDIVDYIARRYKARVFVYITDDYIMERTGENWISRKRRLLIKKQLKKCLEKSAGFFTISAPMRKAYKELFGKDSEMIVNIPDAVRPKMTDPNPFVKFIYAGSLYYGREDIIQAIAVALANYNKTHKKQGKLYIYLNSPLTPSQKEKIVLDGASVYGGALSRDELQAELSSADILVFVESFEEEQINKTVFSLSTKIPEYLSMRKPILAVGPKEVGSMDYLSDVAICVNALDELDARIETIINDAEYKKQYAELAYTKYLSNHDKKSVQDKIEAIIFGAGE